MTAELTRGVTPIPQTLEAWLTSAVAALTGVEPRTIDAREGFTRYGLDSRGAIELTRQLGELLGEPLVPTLIYEYPSIAALVRHLTRGLRGEASPPAVSPGTSRDDEPIAIIGMACRFPQAPDPRAFWRLIAAGVDATSDVPAERWNVERYYDPDATAPGKAIARRGAFLDSVDRFDPLFFGISPREAHDLDPQQRLALELGWEALEDAGIPAPALIGSRTGVFLGSMWHDWADLSHAHVDGMSSHRATGQSINLIANRVSYAFGLRGPSVMIDTACSSALVALQFACRSLWYGDATLALAGGVNLLLAPESMVFCSKFGGLSPDGRCKMFDARADGFGRGEGGGVVVLKPLSLARADGDRVLAIVRGTAVNNDGMSHGLTAPNPRAQEEVLEQAYRRAGVAPAQVHYVEAHGTGTFLGDPIEARALGAVLGAGSGRPATRALAVGSVKTNIGHTEGAAGIAGLIKTVLAMEARAIPPNLHFDVPNPHIAFDELAVRVPKALEPWPAADDAPALAGVSSFGWGGTNAHVVLEGPAPGPRWLGLGADRPEDLAIAARAVRDAAAAGHDEVATSTGAVRLAVTARSRRELAAQLDGFLGGEPHTGLVTGRAAGKRRVAFVCSPLGSQWLGMGRQLMASEPVFHAALARCDRAFLPLTGWSLLAALCQEGPPAPLDDVVRAQPLLFAVQVALAELWRAWGVSPDVVIGHSAGEVAAAHIAGVLTLGDAAQVMHHYSRVQAPTADRGAMAVIERAADEVSAALAEHAGQVEIAAFNSRTSTVISGDVSAVHALVVALKAGGASASVIRSNVAGHSPLMQPCLAELADALTRARLAPQPAAIAMYSTVTSERVRGPELDAGYFPQNLRNPVRLVEVVERLLAEGVDVFVELGPHPVVLQALAHTAARVGQPALVLPSLRRAGDERLSLYDSRSQLWAVGVPDRAREAEAELLVVSARTPEALRTRAGALAAWFDERPELSVADVCYTAGARRTHHEHRAAVVGRSRDELAAALRAHARSDAAALCAGPGGATPKVVFVFPGQGSQWPGMGRRLRASEPVFREALEACERAMQPYVSWSLAAELDVGEASSRLDENDVVQPVLWAIEVALAALWRSWGIEPAAVVGHSMGEVAAAVVAGALSLPDAARVITLRSQIARRHASGKGAMAVVELSFAEAAREIAGLDDRLAVGAANGPRSSVLSGEAESLERVLARLGERGIFCRRVKVDYASHSPQMDPLGPVLLEALSATAPRAGTVPLFSTVSADWLGGERLDAAYWAANLRQPVRFAEAVAALGAAGHNAFIEMSPHPVLLPALEDGLAHLGHIGLAVASLRRNEDERTNLLRSLGALYTRGAALDPEGLWPARGHLVALPGYPFQRARYWLDLGRGADQTAQPTRATGAAPGPGARISHETLARRLLGERRDMASDPGVHLWETALSLAALGYLGDHRVGALAVLPGAGYVDMALAAARELALPAPHALEDLTFERMLVVPETGAIAVQLVVRAGAPGRARFEVYSRLDADWIRNARGILRGAAGAAEPAAPGAPLRGLREYAPEDHYRRMTARGLSYGPSFQGIVGIQHADEVAIARVRLPAGLAASEHVVHPALLDACFQTLAALAVHGSGTRAMLPVAIRQLTLRQPLPPEVVCRVRARGSNATADRLEADLWIEDAEGTLCCEVHGLAAQWVDLAGSAPASELFHEVVWRPVACVAPEAGTTRPARAVLILADTGSVGDGLAAALRAAGDSCARVRHGASLRRLAAGDYEVPRDDPASFTALVHDLAADLGRPAPDAIVHLWTLDAAPLTPTTTTPAALRADTALICGSLVGLVQALVQAGLRDAPRLYVVTCGAQPAGDAATSAPVQALSWGFGRTLVHEHPELRVTLVDLDARDDAAASVTHLHRELAADSDEDQLAFRGGERLAARLVHASQVAAAPGTSGAEPPRVRAAGRPLRLEIRRPGVLDRLTLRPCARRPPGASEIELEVAAAGLNFLDVLLALGSLPSDAPDDAGPQLGHECVGSVTALGESVAGLAVGDQVIALAPRCFGTHALADARLVLRRPPQLSAIDAATVPLAFVTAHYALTHVARLARGERVLIHAAAGGVGLAAVQLAQRAGAEIFATAGSAAKREHLHALGVAHVMSSRDLSFVDDVRARTGGRGVDVVLSSLGGDFLPASLESLASGGRFVELGKRDYHADRRLGLSPFLRRLSFTLVDLRSEMHEHPDRVRAVLQEVLALFEAGALAPLPARVFPMTDAASAFGYMARADHIGKVVLSLDGAEGAPVAGDRPRIAPDRTYLITGGLGGIGLRLARWFADAGARSLALIGRGPASDAAAQAIRALGAAGVAVHTFRADVASPDELAAVLAELDRIGPPLAGVVHAAGVLDDGAVVRLTPARIDHVLAPKLLGAWNLHALLADRQLDLFVMCSSMAALLGSATQAHYGASNAFLGAMAHYRRSQGLPALAIDWGAWSEVGLAAAQANRGERLATLGIESLDPDEGVAAFAELLAEGAVQRAAMRFDVRRWRELHLGPGRSRFLSELGAGSEQPGAGGGFRAELAGMPAGRRRGAMEAHLRAQVASVLRCDPERIAVSMPLQQGGLDSLTAMELRNRLEVSVGLTLNVTLIWRHPTIVDLANHVLSALGLADDAAAPSVGAAMPSATPAPATPALAIDRTDKLAQLLRAVKELSSDA
jgi:acyl transferase domain-containing protein/NADPH:quinone reductase-like Zn-dependent oxidoreductase/acyl carrier protein